MKRALRLPAVVLLGLCVGTVLNVTRAFAAPVPRAAIVSGTSPQTLTLTGGAQLLVQCPAQVISFRPMTSTDVQDGGVSDMRMDFIASPDPFPIRLTPEQSKILFRNIDGGAIACNPFDPL